MKTILFGAAGLLLSTSALAAMPLSKGMARSTSPAIASKGVERLGDSMIGNAITIDWPAKRADARAIDRKHIIAAAKAPPEPAAAEAPSTAAMSDAGDANMTGMGGPDEPVETPPVRAFSANDYPPCASRADDNCIQLYEPGTRESLAAFQASHGLNQTGMGGPEEATEEAGGETAAYQPLPEDAVMPATEDMAELPAAGPDTPIAI